MSPTVIRLGISSCLLGEQVRWDGGHKLDQWLADQLGRFVRYYPVCPEVGCGFGVPREPLCLAGDSQAPRLITSRTKQDHTARMLHWARRRVRELEGAELCGFIFKGKSPSCGTERVRVYNAKGVGIFARVFMEYFPLIPVEDDGCLHDPQFRENFIERVFVMKRWRDALRRYRRSGGDLVRFHTGHKLLILSHSPRHHRIMGHLVAQATPINALYDEYQRLLMEALRLKATPAKHVRVLQHIIKHCEKQLSPDAKGELLEIVDYYRQGHVPLLVPITLINHYVRLYDLAYLKEQHYLHPPRLQLQVSGLL
ncbi:MAG: hypothetical protein A2Z08_10225 [Deltaproteobacteria bacterium RBG_16_54_11]|nr:MAG: hypothetical protein A2Z08_10225 [Deltaproteobacteria bacterium RBG_16_54_11]